MSELATPGLGWQRDLPDFRDYLPTDSRLDALWAGLPESPPETSETDRVDLRDYFPPAYDQQQLNSSPAHACVGLVEYFERRALGQLIPRSRLFLHQVTLKLLRAEGNTGADLRTTLKALVRFGAPPEAYWPYAPAKVDEAPEPFLYGFADAFRSLRFVRVDARNATGSQTLDVVRSFLAAGFPMAFGFSVPSSVTSDADIPYRPTFDAVHNGQAAIAVGYDDNRLHTSRGALLIRNSWGISWGDNGYGWLPYAYVRERLAVDFWTLLSTDWFSSGEFQAPRILS